MKFSTPMIQMDGVEELIQAQDERGGPDLKRAELGSEEVENEFVIIDENSIYGRRRHSIEERNERRHLTRGDREAAIGDNDETEGGITLYPFAHQVGGHTQLLSLDKGTLCKPLVPRELLFYLNVPKQLASFVPTYKGWWRLG